MNLLIVDDAPTNLKLLRTQLESEGHAVFEAHDGVDALALLERQPVDVVISDILMPRMDGYRLSYEIRQHARLRDLPIILCTSTYTSPGDEKLALDVGADKCLKKPFLFETLVAALYEVIAMPHAALQPKALLEVDVLKEYSEWLVSKLEERALQLEQSTRDLAEREARLRAIFENEPECVKLLAADGALLEMNSAGLRMLEADSLQQVVNRCIYPLVVEEHRAVFRELTEKVFRGESGALEFQLTGLKGGRRWLETHAVPLRDAQDRVTTLLGITRDITERKRAEALLNGQKQVLEMIAVGAPLGESLTALVRLIEAHAPGMLGSILLLDEDGVHLRDGAAPSLPPEYVAAIEGMSIGPSAGSCGTAAYSKEAVVVEDIATDPRWAEYKAVALPHGLRACWSTPIFGAQRRVFGTFAMYYRQPALPQPDHQRLIDIAAHTAAIAIGRQRTETALRESAERLRFAVQASNVGLWDWDLRTNQVIYSREWKSQLGYEETELRNEFSEWERLVHPDDLAAAQEGIQRYLAQPEGAYEAEFRMRHKDGTWRWIYARGEFFRDANGEAVRMMGCHIDFTERKQADQKFKALLESAPDAMVIVNRDAEMVLINAQAVKLFGWRCEELLAQKIEILVPERFRGTHPGNRNGFFAQPHARAMGAGLELFGLRKDGTEFPVEISLSPLETNEGTLVMSAIRDITARKQADAALRQSEARLQEAQRIARLGSWDWDITTNALSWSDEIYRIFELTPQQFRATYPAFLERVHPLDRSRVMAAVDAAVHAAAPYDIEHRIVLPDGRERTVHENGFVFRDETGRALRMLGTVQDITERKQAEEALRTSEERFKTMFVQAPLGIALIDSLTGHIYEANPRFAEIAGRSMEELPNIDWIQITHPDDVQADLDNMALLNAGKTNGFQMEKRYLHPDGTAVWINMAIAPLKVEDKAHPRHLCMVQDITERKKAEDRIAYLNRVYAMLSNINSLIVRVRDRDELFRDACRIAVEEGGFRMTWIGIVDRSAMKIVPIASAGAKPEFLTHIQDHFPLREDAPLGNTMSARAVRGKKTIVFNNIRGDPKISYAKERIEQGISSIAVLPLLVSDEAVGVLVLYAGEIDFFQEEELKLLMELAGDIAFAIDHIANRERIDYLAYYDELTGLANRTLFLERVAQYMRSAVSGGHKLALYLIDLERFKNINDSLGRPAGDALLRQVAEWLTRTVGDANLLARVGADHFAAVLPEVKQDGDAARFLEKTLEAFLEHPFHLNDGVFRIATRVGVALFPDDGADADTLFRNAEAALKKAKASGDRYLFYTQKMTEAVAGKLTLENQLRQALDNEEFVLHYQPKVNLASGKLTGAEALIRWNDPRTGLVPPGRFIPILEETGLIYEVGRWALRKAIEDYLRWHAAGLPAVRIAVNVSPLQLRHRGFIAEIGQAIGIDAHAAAGLELEITESLIMEDVKHNIASLQEIRAMGVTIAIDDFGTGFSSLSYLAKLPVDTLKIDRSFVIDMTAGPEGLALVSTVINLAHSLKLKVVAEGVETEEQSRLLRLLRCDEMQGFLFSKPVPSEIFETRFLAPPPAG